MKRTHPFIKALLAIGAAFCAVSGAAAQGQGPLSIIVPYAPGGGADVVSRALSDTLGAKLGRTVVVQNRTGAGGRIALQALKGLPQGTDGVIIGFTGILTNSILFRDQSNYDFKNDFVPLAQLGRVPLGLIAKGGRYADLKDFIAKQPEKILTYAHYGPGSLSHLVGLNFSEEIGFTPEAVAYQGMAVMLNDLMGEQFEASIDTIGDYAERHKAGAVRVLATFGAERSSFIPDAPTLAEQGYRNIQGGEVWLGLFANKQTSPELLARIQDALRDSLQEAPIREKLKPLIQIDYKNSEAFKAIVHEGYDYWLPVIDRLGIRNH